MVNLQDVADEAGYSLMTASRALSGQGYVSSRAYNAVREAAERLGYFPNGVARSLRHSRTGWVALVISDIENPFYASIAKTAERRLTIAGYRLLIASSEEDPEVERQVVASVLEARPEALLITPTGKDGADLRRLADKTLPVVQIDRVADGSRCGSVLLDNREAASRTIDHLVAFGHRHVAFISGPSHLTTGSERRAGAAAAAQAAGPEVRLEMVEAESYLHADAACAVQKALETSPSAIVAGNNVVAEACMSVFSARQIAIPDDISLVTFDDLPWMRWLRAPLTALRQPIEAMTAKAVEIALAEVDGREEQHSSTLHARFAGELIQRSSVRNMLEVASGT